MISLTLRLSFISFILVVCCYATGLAETENWDTLNTAGMLAYQKKDFLTAKNLFERALETLEQGEQPDPHAATTLNNLGAVHEKLGEFDQAEVFYIRAIRITEHSLNPEHPRLISLYTRYGSLLRQANREEEATVVDRKIESLRSANTVSPENPD